MSCRESKLLVQLQVMGLSNNALEGSLPENWGNLTNVSLLNTFTVSLILVHAFSAPQKQCSSEVATVLEHVSVKSKDQRPRAQCLTL